MSRKSKAQRIAEGNALITAIKQDPVLTREQSWLIGFLTDLVSKFQRGKGGTSRQRSLFDDKIAAGVPARKVNNHIAQPEVKELEPLLTLFQGQEGLYEWESRVGSELVEQGLRYNLSDNQMTLVSKLISRAKSIQAQQEAPAQSAERIETAKLYLELAKCYTSMPARKAKDVNVVANAIKNCIPFTDDQFNALEEAVKGQKKKYDKAVRKCPVGTLMKVNLASPFSVCPSDCDYGIIAGAPEFESRQHQNMWQGNHTNTWFSIPVLVGEEIRLVNPSRISRITKKELKAMGIK